MVFILLRMNEAKEKKKKIFSILFRLFIECLAQALALKRMCLDKNHQTIKTNNTREKTMSKVHNLISSCMPVCGIQVSECADITYCQLPIQSKIDHYKK